MGTAPIKWTCTVSSFRLKHSTDRAILAIRQSQEKKPGRVQTPRRAILMHGEFPPIDPLKYDDLESFDGELPLMKNRN